MNELYYSDDTTSDRGKNPLKIKEIIVVEGKDDTAKVKQAIEADTIETNGSAINGRTLEEIRHAIEKRGVIVFTDPDYPGQRIRNIINEHAPGCKHAFLTKDEARAKQDKGIGIEHASLETIREALSRVYQLEEEQILEITRDDLLRHGLIGGKNASHKRDILTRHLRIGHANGKQLLKRLNMFKISHAEFEHVLNMIEEGELDV